MTITSQEARELRKRITQLVKAEVAHSWKGTDTAETFADYDRELEDARRRLNTYIGGLLHSNGSVKP